MNKQQLAIALDCSLSTLTDLLARHGAAFPVVNYGSNGRPFKFEPRAVVAHLRRCGDYRADILEAKLPRKLVYQLRADEADDVGNRSARALRFCDIQEAMDADFGQIILYSEMIASMAEAGETVDNGVKADVRRTLKAAGVPAATIRAVEGIIKTARRTFTAEIEALFAPAFSAWAMAEDEPVADEVPA